MNLNYHFSNPDLLKTALTHSSYFNEIKNKQKDTKVPGHNERLEFLGDAVLDLALGQILMELFPELEEGRLSKRRASLVNENTLAAVGRRLGLPEAISFGRGELKARAQESSRLVASALEAVVGAIFLDSNYEQAKKWVAESFASELQNLSEDKDFAEDFKTRLQEMVQNLRQPLPVYQVLSESGPSHLRQYEVEVRLDGHWIASGSGKSKKLAEQAAAKKAIDFLLSQGKT